MVVRVSRVAVEGNLHTKCHPDSGTVCPPSDDSIVRHSPARLRGTRYHSMTRSQEFR